MQIILSIINKIGIFGNHIQGFYCGIRMMSKKFRGKYRIESTRLRYWDYGSNAAYFVTLCTKHRAHYFGEIRNGKMYRTEIGEIAHRYWQEIPQHFPFVKLGEFIVMPNHVHGIIIIDKPEGQGVPKRIAIKQPQNDDKPANRFGPQSKNLASIVRGYKAAVKKYATMHNIEFAWQPLYYDHIIRNEMAYYRISQYIKNNPLKWKEDRFS